MEKHQEQYGTIQILPSMDPGESDPPSSKPTQQDKPSAEPEPQPVEEELVEKAKPEHIPDDEPDREPREDMEMPEVKRPQAEVKPAIKPEAKPEPKPAPVEPQHVSEKVEPSKKVDEEASRKVSKTEVEEPEQPKPTTAKSSAISRLRRRALTNPSSSTTDPESETTESATVESKADSSELDTATITYNLKNNKTTRISSDETSVDKPTDKQMNRRSMKVESKPIMEEQPIPEVKRSGSSIRLSQNEPPIKELPKQITQIETKDNTPPASRRAVTEIKTTKEPTLVKQFSKPDLPSNDADNVSPTLTKKQQPEEPQPSISTESASEDIKPNAPTATNISKPYNRFSYSTSTFKTPNTISSRIDRFNQPTATNAFKREEIPVQAKPVSWPKVS